jgi:diguanylate cyclase (GGDEF)-like protein
MSPDVLHREADTPMTGADSIGPLRRDVTMAFRGHVRPALLLRPATRLIGRLRYAHKFVVVGLVLLIPLGFVANAYVGLQRGQIAFSTKERQGIWLMGPLVALTTAVVTARHDAVVPFTHEAAPVAAPLELVDRADREVGSILGTTENWRAVRRLVLEAQNSSGDARARFDAYNHVIDQLTELMVVVGDASKLTLDPDLDTYYLMDLLQFRLPALLDTAGRSADRTVLAATGTPGGYNAALIALGLDSGVLENTRQMMSRGVATICAKTADPRVRADIRATFDRMNATTTALSRELTDAVKAGLVTAVSPHAADQTRVAAAALATEAVRSLDDLLRTRIEHFSDRAREIQIWTGIAALLAIYLFVGFYLSVTGPIRRIVGTLHAVAGGDLTRRVCVDTRDELAFVARALNDTVARTEAATERLAIQATHDTLTGLPNRALVLDRLVQALERAALHRRLMAVFFIDLDRFKMINDSLGHETGDEVLSAVADRLTGLVRANDTVGRLAGDEFVVVAQQLTTSAEAVAMAEQIVEVLTGPITVAGAAGPRELNVGASVGIAFSDGMDELSPDDMLRDADVAMYRAKQRGRGRVEIFDQALRAAVERDLEIQHDLRGAIEAGQLRVYYQPIVDATHGRVAGFEALVRWQHPTRGLLFPCDFIDLAEASGLIVPLGAAVLAEACRQTAIWRATRTDHPDLHIAVNVSPAQFSHPSFVTTLASVLVATGLDPGALWLEITENSIMADAEATGETLNQIRALGVHLAIDDFGTGYSSLAYLRRFPVEVLKIDRSFVSGLGGEPEDEAIVEMIIALARSLELVVVAEGVETASQLEHLKWLGCSTIQGYYFAKPTTAELAWSTVTDRLAEPVVQSAAQAS